MQAHQIRRRLIDAVSLLVAILAGLPAAVGGEPSSAAQRASSDTTAAQVAAIARVEKAYFEETKREHNEQLNEVFRDFLKLHGGTSTSSLVQSFNALVHQHGMTNFDDFLLAETTPLKHRKDPDTGELVPIMGPLGSDVINPWLAALEVLPGKPLDEQPIYQLAAKALKEHIDFAVIGVHNPTLSLDLLPPKLRENAAAAYKRLNPTNKFNGGFDDPLFYSAVREGAKNLFRVDYPKLRVNMAELVVPEEQGGFGIRSCLLCHDRNHSGVYQRLLSQGTYLKTKAADMAAGDPELAQIQKLSSEFLTAAEIVQRSHPDKVDVRAAQDAMAALSTDNVGRLRPGYSDFCNTLRGLGCLKCHSKGADVPGDKDPSIFGAYVLDMNDYYCTSNVKALLSVVNLGDLDKSKLMLKATGTVDHEGADDIKLNEVQSQQLRSALARWIYSGNGQEAAASGAATADK